MLVEMQQDQFNELYDLMTQSFHRMNSDLMKNNGHCWKSQSIPSTSIKRTMKSGLFSRLGKQMNLCFSNTLL